MLKHGVFFLRARAIGEKELLARVQCLSLHCSGTKPVLYPAKIPLCTPDSLSRVRALSIDLASN